MSASEDISLHESLPHESSEYDRRDSEQDAASALEQADLRQLESKGRRYRALVGSGLLQLPIWGFAMTYGVFQEYYSSNKWDLSGSQQVTGIIGTTSNGVMYLSMPFLFALFTKRWARWRRTAALCGAALTCFSFLLSSFSTAVWHLVVTQGILAAFGCALVYSPTTLSLGEWYSTHNRALAYGAVLSCKNIVGSACPFLMRGLLDRYGLGVTLRAWGAIAAGTAVLGAFLIPAHPSSLAAARTPRARKIPWHFLRHQTIYIYSVAIVLQSAGYGIPQTYLAEYARDVTALSQTSATLLLTIFNVPGIAASAFFGYLTDNKRYPLSTHTVTTISAASSALATFLLWGLTSKGSFALLLLFAGTYGCFAGGYSATWGGIINDLEQEAARANEAVDPGLLYGLLNGARGVGFVSGGLAGVPLLKAGASSAMKGYGYGSSYGPLIVFTGLSSAFGGWSMLWKCKKQRA